MSCTGTIFGCVRRTLSRQISNRAPAVDVLEESPFPRVQDTLLANARFVVQTGASTQMDERVWFSHRIVGPIVGAQRMSRLGLPSECLPRPTVERGRYGLDVLVAPASKVGDFGCLCVCQAAGRAFVDCSVAGPGCDLFEELVDGVVLGRVCQ